MAVKREKVHFETVEQYLNCGKNKAMKTIDYEQFKERIEEDLHQALADH